jgi:hypothetical protein
LPPSQTFSFGFCQLRFTSVCVPFSVESIGNHCFARCDNLSSLTFESPSKLADIGASVFVYCLSLRSVTLAAPVEAVEAIAENGFAGCSKLSIVGFESGCRLGQLRPKSQVAKSGKLRLSA